MHFAILMIIAFELQFLCVTSEYLFFLSHTHRHDSSKLNYRAIQNKWAMDAMVIACQFIPFMEYGNGVLLNLSPAWMWIQQTQNKPKMQYGCQLSRTNDQ
jgi:hypothetical protein